MKNTFHAHFRPTDEEFKELWKNGIMAVDTNIILNLYRYSQKTQTVLLQVLDSFKGQIWLPYRAGSEYFKNRISTISGQIKSYKEISDSIKKNLSSLQDIRRHPFVKDDTLIEFERVFAKIESEFLIETELLTKKLVNDDILIKVSELFKEKVGNQFAEDDLNKILKEGETRYPSNIPPGFNDDKKKDPDPTVRFGDLIIWKELIAKANQDKKPLIFITDDKKEDWWLEGVGKKIGPLPQLLDEFKRESQQQFYMYTADQFISLASSQKGVDDDVIQELKDIREEQELLSDLRNLNDVYAIEQDFYEDIEFVIYQDYQNSYFKPSLNIEGRIALSGPGFDSTSKAYDWIQDVVQSSNSDENFHRHTSRNKFSFSLKNISGNFIATGDYFNSDKEMEKVIFSIRANAQSANILFR